MPADTSALKKRVIELITDGHTIDLAMTKVKRHPRTYDYWRKTDAEFAEKCDHARTMRDNRRAGLSHEVPDFPTFCAEFLRQPLHFHQLQWYDLLEGREPRDLHPAETYTQGDPDRLLVNTPIDHAKSTTLSVNYVTWRICQDPNIRVLIVSKAQDMAKKFLYSIKNRMEHPAYRDLQVAFAPEGGWKASADAWTANMIYVGGADRSSGEKDPTVQALGMRGHIYGARADLIIIDDGVALDNSHEYEKQITWIEQEVESRLVGGGKLIIVGTRIAPQDLYGEINRGERYGDGEPPWTYLVQPAVLEYADKPEDWVTLWPKATVPCKCRALCQLGKLDPDESGMYPRFDGQHAARVRNRVQPRTWSLVYMNQQLVEDAVFAAAAVQHAIDGQRMPGLMRPGAMGHREYGMEGLYVVAGLDPAMTENTAAIVMGVDRATKERWVLDVFDKRSVTPQAMRDLIKEWTVRYGIHEWRIEKNAFQIMLTQDPEINTFLASRGCLLKEHFTGRNKWAPDFGVASMALMFGQYTRVATGNGGFQEVVEGGLIHLPSTKDSEATRRLVSQLITWAPETKNKTDIVMALWFAEIRAREVVAPRHTGSHASNRYLGRTRANQRMVINLDDAYQEQQGYTSRSDLTQYEYDPV